MHIYIHVAAILTEALVISSSQYIRALSQYGLCPSHCIRARPPYQGTKLGNNGHGPEFRSHVQPYYRLVLIPRTSCLCFEVC